VARRRLKRLVSETPAAASLDSHLAGIESSAHRIAGALDELLDVAHLQAGRTLRLNRAPTPLEAVVQAVVAAHQPRTERHCLRVVATARPVGTWDAARLARVVDNLVSNAIKYSPEGGEISLEIAEEHRADGTLLATLRVCDEGVGVPAADIDQVFERFFRASNVGPIAGTGIGLAGARQIVEQHGGTLTAESREGAGSTFILRLPL
jgi:signal transduction histidine kinase